MRRNVGRDPFMIQHRLRDAVGLVVAMLVLSASLYGESVANRPQTAARPKPPSFESEPAKLPGQGAVEQHLQQTLEKADFEISTKLQTRRP
jgi:hypothetical protein